jgi:hypothetical protein
MSQAPQPEAQAPPTQAQQEAPAGQAQAQPVVQAPAGPSKPSTEDFVSLFTLIASLKKLQSEAKSIKEEYRECFEVSPHSLKCPTVSLWNLLAKKLQEIREARDSLVFTFVELASTSRITSKQFLELIDRAYSVNLSPSKEWEIEDYIKAFNTALDKLLSDEALGSFIDLILMALRPETSSMVPQ